MKSQLNWMFTKNFFNFLRQSCWFSEDFVWTLKVLKPPSVWGIGKCISCSNVIYFTLDNTYHRLNIPLKACVLSVTKHCVCVYVYIIYNYVVYRTNGKTPSDIYYIFLSMCMACKCVRAVEN